MDEHFEVRLVDWLEVESTGREPADLITTTLAVTAGTQQVAPGTVAGGWYRLREARIRLPGSVRLAIAVGLLVLTAVAAMLAIGAMRPALPRNGSIALEAGGNIWVLSPDGRRMEPLANAAGLRGSPSWSPNGETLAYLESGEVGPRILLLDPRTGATRTLALPATLKVADGATVEGWSADGRSLVVPIADAGDVVSAALIDVEDGRVTLVDRHPSYSFGFSPDGRWLGLKWVHGPYADIVVTDARGEQARTLVANGRTLDRPAFLPDGSAIVFHQQSSPTTYDGDIEVVDVLTAQVRTLVGGPSNDVEPRVAPDGHAIAFSRSPTPNISAAFDALDGSVTPADLYVAGVDGGEPRLLATGIWPGAVWSPDGLTGWLPSHRTCGSCS